MPGPPSAQAGRSSERNRAPSAWPLACVGGGRPSTPPALRRSLTTPPYREQPELSLLTAGLSLRELERSYRPCCQAQPCQSSSCPRQPCLLLAPRAARPPRGPADRREEVALTSRERRCARCRPGLRADRQRDGHLPLRGRPPHGADHDEASHPPIQETGSCGTWTGPAGPRAAYCAARNKKVPDDTDDPWGIG